MEKIGIYIEEGQKKTFVVTPDWPGWARWGKDEALALDSLLAYAPKYAQVMASAEVTFDLPKSIEDFRVFDKVKGNATTSFGAPDIQLPGDEIPLDETELQRQMKILTAAWEAFDQMVDSAWGKELRKGPRGGGRDLEKIILHTLGADEAYLKRLARPFKFDFADPLEVQTEKVRQAVQNAVDAGMRGEIPDKGPRGGRIWTLRFYLRRVIWHTLDHVWEIEERIIV